MERHLRWQVIIAFLGVAITMTFLGFLAFSRTTVTVLDVGGTYTEGVAGVPQFINPLLAHYNQVDQDLTALIFNGLTRSDGQGGLESDLAESWELSDDGLVYLFKLKPEIRWQDNEPFTVDDVIFTINLMKDPEFPGVAYLGDLWRTITVERLDDYTIRFILPEPFPSFADFTTTGILPEHLLKNMKAGEMISHPFNLSPVGTGLFKLDEIDSKAAHLSFNPLYNGSVEPRITNLEIRFYASQQEAIGAYMSGEIQGISFIPPQFIPMVSNFNSLNIYTARMSGYEIIYLNLQDPENLPFFQDVKVRRAMMYALDRQAIIDEALFGQGLIANGPIRSWSWAYNPKQLIYSFKPHKARALLTKDGWIDRDKDGIRDKAGVSLAFTLLVSDTPDKIKVAELVSEQWYQVGISATVKIAGAKLGEQLTTHKFQAAMAEIILRGDPDPYPLWHQTQIENGQNYSGWNNDRASILLEAARTITNKGRRNDFYYEFQQIFADEIPSLILFYPVYNYGVSRDVYDVQLFPMTKPADRFRSIADWYTTTSQVDYNYR